MIECGAHRHDCRLDFIVGRADKPAARCTGLLESIPTRNRQSRAAHGQGLCHKNSLADTGSVREGRLRPQRSHAPTACRLRSVEAQCPAGDEVALEGEGVLDCGLGGDEALG